MVGRGDSSEVTSGRLDASGPAGHAFGRALPVVTGTSRTWHQPAPCLVAAGQVGGSAQSEAAQRGGGETEAEAFVAHHDDARVRVAGFRDVVRAGRIEAPLEDVAVDDDGAG
jgi:hypothetical protein